MAITANFLPNLRRQIKKQKHIKITRKLKKQQTKLSMTLRKIKTILLFFLIIACNNSKRVYHFQKCICDNVDICLTVKNNILYYTNTDTCDRDKIVDIDEEKEKINKLELKIEYYPKVIPLIDLNQKDSSYINVIKLKQLSPKMVFAENIAKIAYIENRFFSKNYNDTIYRVFIRNIYSRGDIEVGVTLSKTKGVLGYYEIDTGMKNDRRRVIYKKFVRGEGFLEQIDSLFYIVSDENVYKL